MTDRVIPLSDSELEMLRATRFSGQPAGAEEEYEASCRRTEALTVEDIWGPDGEPPFPPIAPFRTSDAAHAAQDVTDPNPAPLPRDPWE